MSEKRIVTDDLATHYRRHIEDHPEEHDHYTIRALLDCREVLLEVLGYIVTPDELVEASGGAWAEQALRRCQEQAQWALSKAQAPSVERCRLCDIEYRAGRRS